MVNEFQDVSKPTENSSSKDLYAGFMYGVPISAYPPVTFLFGEGELGGKGYEDQQQPLEPPSKTTGPGKIPPPNNGGQVDLSNDPSIPHEVAVPFYLDPQRFYEELVAAADTSGDGKADKNELADYQARTRPFIGARSLMLDKFNSIATGGSEAPDTNPSDDIVDFGDVNSLYGIVPSTVADSVKAVAQSTGNSFMTREQLVAHRESLSGTGDTKKLADAINVLINFDKIQVAQDDTTVSREEALAASRLAATKRQ